MIVNLLYLFVGIVVGVLVKYEFEIRSREKKVQKRMAHVQSAQEEYSVERKDKTLRSLKGVNKSLASIREENREVN